MENAKSIVFDSQDIKGILDERKTVTRRWIRPKQLRALGCDRCPNDLPDEYIKEKSFLFKPWCDMADSELISSIYKEPYQPGDITYVREQGIIHCMKNFNQSVKIYFPADDSLVEFKVTSDEYNRLSKLQENKILSPYWFTKQESRLWLKVNGVRAEKLQDIDLYEINNKEGIGEKCIGLSVCGGGCDTCPADSNVYKQMYINKWNSYVKKSQLEKYGWDANPWVWRIEFEQYKKLV